MFNFSSELQYKDQLDTNDFSLEQDLIVVDRILENQLKDFLNSFSHVYFVDAGEPLKNIEHFSNHVKNILETWGSQISRDHRIISIGGGSVGDFSGFVASVLKRGVQLTHVPTTWLSAVDSAHGGKTALNVGGVKNQVGSFYPADTVFLVKEILK